jgi:serine protease
MAGTAHAVPNVTQVIDGLPQVVAPQQLIVSCSPSVQQVFCASALASVGATIVATGQAAFNLAVLPNGVSLQSALDTLRASTAIASADPNRILIGSTTYPQTWNFPAVQAPGDSTLLPAGASPLVAVVDTGIAYESDLLGLHARAPVFNATSFAPGWDFVNNGSHPDDDNGHGTAMATIIAGQGTFSSAAIPYVGPAAGATLMPVKVLDASNQGTEFWLEEGIRYAVRGGARVINLSLDFARNYVPGAALRDAIAAARAARVVVVGASGNTGDGRVLFPAAFPDVISVGAFRLDAVTGYAMTSYSNWGDALDLAAPGGMPGQDVNQDGLWDGVLAQSFPPGAPTQIGWWLFAGTSPATAHVSAAAAALIGNGQDAGAVRPLLQATAAALGVGGWNPASGSGRLQIASAIYPNKSLDWPPKSLYADAVAALLADGTAAGAVMIADAGGNGLSGAEVHVRWRGAATAAQTATTDWSGIARFVSPAPASARKLFLIEVPRVIYRGAAQRPRPFARSGGDFDTLIVSASLSAGGSFSSIGGLTIWGYGFSQAAGLASGTTGSGLASGTTGSGLASGTTGSGLASGTTGSGLGSGTTGSGGSGTPPSYPLTTGINACLRPLPLYSYGPSSWWADSAFFSGAPLASGYSVRALDSAWVLTPGAAALDATELGNICGVTTAQAAWLSGNYFWSGTLYVAGAGSPPAGMGVGDGARFWSEVMNAEGSTAP